MIGEQRRHPWFFALLVTFVLGIALVESVLAESPLIESPKIIAQREELVELRTPYAQYFRNADGSRTVRSTLGSTFYRDDKGNWAEIDPEIRPLTRDGFALGMTKNRFQVFFNQTAWSPKKLQYGNAWLEFIPLDAVGTSARVERNRITYHGAWPDVDLTYFVGRDSLKEDIILLSSSAPASYRFKIRSHGLRQERFGDKGLRFVDPNSNRVIFELGQPYMYDASEGPWRYASVSVGFLEERDGLVVTFSAAREWLSDPKRRYPVVIDPYITVQPDGAAGKDVTVGSFYNWPATATELLVETTGSLGGIDTQTFIEFNLASLLPTGSTIDQARLGVYQSHGDNWWDSQFPPQNHNEPVQVRRVLQPWSESLTWSTRPSINSTYETVTYVDSTQSGWYWTTITNLVSGWVNGSYPNYGMVLLKPSGTYYGNYVYSSDYAADTSLRPILEITYTEVPPTATPTFPSQGAAFTQTPSLSWSYSDPQNDPQAKFEVQISPYSSFATIFHSSGVVNSGATSYAPPNLAPGIWYWRVRVWDTKGTESVWGASDFKMFENVSGTQEPVRYEYDNLANRTLDATFTRDGQGNDVYHNQIGYAYDELNRMKKVTYPDGVTVKIYYSTLTGGNRQERVETYAADGTTLQNRVTITYDPMDRKTSEAWEIDGTSYTVGYQYDGVGNVKKVTYPDSTFVEYVYDEWHQVTAIPGYAGTATSPAFTYRDTGFLTGITYGNGVQMTITPDSRNRPDVISIPSLGVNWDYTYDGESNITAISSASPQYTYDGLNRLTSAVAGSRTVTYQYDAAGNRSQESWTDGTNRSYAYDGGNHLTGYDNVSLDYGTYGQLVTKKNASTNEVLATYSYDGARRLAGVTQGSTTASYTYDGLGRRIKTVENGTPTITLPMGNDILYEKRGTEVTKYVYGAGRHIAKVDSTGTTYYHTDHLGSTRLVTNSTGTKVADLTYGPFGKTVAATGSEASNQKHRFTGKREESAVGLYYYGARFYDPEVGRFITQDAWKGTLWDPSTQNLYVYVLNNPLKYTDPSGHCVWDVCIGEGVVAALAAAAITLTPVMQDVIGDLSQRFGDGISAIANGARTYFAKSKDPNEKGGAGKPTSKTFGKPIETTIDGRKVQLRVDAEPDANKIQIQAGRGKDSDVDIRIDPTEPLEPQIPRYLNLSSGQRKELLKNLTKAVKWLNE